MRREGDYPQARELAEEMLSRRRRILGDDHPDTLTSASQLGMVLWYLGDYQQARQLLSDTLARSRRVLGEDHPDTLPAASLSAWSCGHWVTISRPGSS